MEQTDFRPWILVVIEQIKCFTFSISNERGGGCGLLCIKSYLYIDYLFVLFDEIYTFNNVISNQEYKHRFRSLIYTRIISNQKDNLGFNKWYI